MGGPKRQQHREVAVRFTTEKEFEVYQSSCASFHFVNSSDRLQSRTMACDSTNRA